MLKPSLIAHPRPKADEAQMRVIGDVRVTFLTPRLLRVEVGDFCDRASYAVWYRQGPAGRLTLSRKGRDLIAETDDIVLTIRKKVPYSVTFKDTGATEVLAKQINLKGTWRTLDGTSGPVTLGDGFLTEAGACLFDDSGSVLLDEEGRLVARPEGSRDWYVFAYGKDYRETLAAYYKIGGAVPVVPRFALGVWWSRYHAYTQEEYLSLMDRFAAEGVPLTVATVDMDWHWTNIEKQFGVTGEQEPYSVTKLKWCHWAKYAWTGYSWNTELFPDYRAFLRELHEKNLRVTLNLHPADGVRWFDTMYPEMARANGIDPATRETVRFRCGSDDFWNSYFDVLHKPYEKEGVDFWWIDWQQGKTWDVPGLDPLVALNHYHYLDNAENGQIPLTLSRYGGAGSHRYPLGFSGDTAMKWEALAFQPYFTVTAANAAYGWWSHDIGGHHQGYRDDDLYLRWLQFGVFAPILRLLSTSSQLVGKEPWKYRQDVCESAKRWLTFRHRMIPYTFSMDRRYHETGIPLCEPMYYSCPNEAAAYEVPNQYRFGSELIVCPITSPQHRENGMGSVEAWIPEGKYTDIFTGQVYRGPRKLTLNRELYTIPVLAKEGAVLPLSADKGNACGNPTALEVWVFKGNSTFVMLEDNGQTDCEAHTARTVFENAYDEKTNTVRLTVRVEGDLSVIPEGRTYTFRFRDVDAPDETRPFSTLPIEVAVTAKPRAKEPLRARIINALSRWNEDNNKKNGAFERHFAAFVTAKEDPSVLEGVEDVPKAVMDVIREMAAEI